MTEEIPVAAETQESIAEALAKGKLKRVRRILRDLSAAETAELLEQLDEDQQQIVWDQIGDVEEPAILELLDPALAERLQVNSDDNQLEALLDSEDETDISPIAIVREALEAGRFKRALKVFALLHPSQAAGLLESLPPGERSSIWSRLDSARAGQILVHLREEVAARSEEHTSELQSRPHLVCRLLL